MLEQLEHRIIEFIHIGLGGRGDENRIITRDGAEDPFGFAQGVQQARDQLGRAWTGMDHQQEAVMVNVQYQILQHQHRS